MDTPRKYTSHREMKRDRLRHQVSMTVSPPGSSKYDGVNRQADHRYHTKRQLDDMRSQPSTPSRTPNSQALGNHHAHNLITVTATREQGKGLGLTFEKQDGEASLVLHEVAQGSEGDRLHMDRFIGMRLHSVNNIAVASNSKLAAICEGNTSLLFAFENDEREHSAPPSLALSHQRTPQHTSAEQLRDDIHRHKADFQSEMDLDLGHTDDHRKSSHRSLQREIRRHGAEVSPQSSVPREHFDPYRNDTSPRHTSYKKLKDDVRKHSFEMEYNKTPSEASSRRAPSGGRGGGGNMQMAIDNFGAAQEYAQFPPDHEHHQHHYSHAKLSRDIRHHQDTDISSERDRRMDTPSSLPLSENGHSHHQSYDRLKQDIRRHQDTDITPVAHNLAEHRPAPAHHTSYSRLEHDIKTHNVDLVEDTEEYLRPHQTLPQDGHEHSYSKLSKDVKHCRSPMRNYLEEGSRPSTGRVIGDNEGIFYKRNNEAGSPQHDPTVAHRSQKRFEAEKNDHLTPIVGSSSVPSHAHSLREKLHGARQTHATDLFKPLLGSWVCGDGTPCLVEADGTAFYGPRGVNAPPNQRETVTLAEGGGFELMGTRSEQVTPNRVEWGDGDVWTRAPGGGGGGPKTMSAVLYRDSRDKVLGLVWKGASTVIHSVQAGSTADLCGMRDYEGMNVVSVNGVHYPDAHAFASAVSSGELRDAPELRFEFESDLTNVSM